MHMDGSSGRSPPTPRTQKLDGWLGEYHPRGCGSTASGECASSGASKRPKFWQYNPRRLKAESTVFNFSRGCSGSERAAVPRAAAERPAWLGVWCARLGQCQPLCPPTRHAHPRLSRNGQRLGMTLVSSGFPYSTGISTGASGRPWTTWFPVGVMDILSLIFDFPVKTRLSRMTAGANERRAEHRFVRFRTWLMVLKGRRVELSLSYYNGGELKFQVDNEYHKDPLRWNN